MADIAADAGVSPDEPFLSGAGKLCAHLWDEAWDHAHGTAGGDADDLHDMRVALRRLRSALQNFEGQDEAVLVAPHLRREMKKWRRRLGRLGDALGVVRDRDVLDEYVRDFVKDRLKVSIEEAPGLSRFTRVLQTERAEFFGPMVKRINRAPEESGDREIFARWARGLAGASGPTLTVREAAHQILPLRLDEVAALGHTLEDAEDEIGHHDLRKALRRTRYTLETFAPSWDEAVKSHVKIIVSGQDLLGELQDRAVLQESVERVFEIGDDEAAHANLSEDVRAFLDYGERRRRALLGQARKFWRDQNEAGFFDHLRAMK